MDYGKLIKVQEALSRKVVVKPLEGEVELVGGVDVAFDRNTNTAFAAICVLDRALSLVDLSVGITSIRMPYIPGFLSFREFPPIYRAFKNLRVMPDVFILDSQGIAHPRKLGLASHFGVILGVPSIGCAKSRLIGSYKEVGEKQWDFSLLYDGNDVIGYVVRTRRGVKPVFLSVGHLVDLESSFEVVKMFVAGYRLPEPTRLAHIYADKAKKGLLKGA